MPGGTGSKPFSNSEPPDLAPLALPASPRSQQSGTPVAWGPHWSTIRPSPLVCDPMAAPSSKLFLCLSWQCPPSVALPLGLPFLGWPFPMTAQLWKVPQTPLLIQGDGSSAPPPPAVPTLGVLSTHLSHHSCSTELSRNTFNATWSK